MGTPWFKSGSLEWDANGVLAEGALAYFYDAGTSTPKAVYQDGNESTAHEFPLEADGGRWPAVFVPFGSYKCVIKTAGGTTLFSADNVPNPEPVSVDFELDTTSVLNTGDIFSSVVNGIRSGAVRCNGRTIGDASSSATERSNADTADLFAHLWNNISDSFAPVSGGRGATAAADFAAHKPIRLPDWRAGGPVGFDDMGNSAAGLLSGAPVIIGDAITSGSALGSNLHQLSSSEIPVHTHSFSATTGAGSAHTHGVSGNTGSEAAHTHEGNTNGVSANHSHSYNTAINKIGQATGFATIGGSIWNGADASTTTGNQSADHFHGFISGAGTSHLHSISLTSASESSHTHSVSGTSGSTGGDGFHNNLARSPLVTWYIKL